MGKRCIVGIFYWHVANQTEWAVSVETDCGPLLCPPITQANHIRWVNIQVMGNKQHGQIYSATSSHAQLIVSNCMDSINVARYPLLLS